MATRHAQNAFSLLEGSGAAARAHSGATLAAHLQGVHAILERWEQPAHVRCAGLLHSLYGTEPYANPLVDVERRDRIRRRVGAAAERAIYDYCATPLVFLIRCGLRSGEVRVLDRFAGGLRVLSCEAIDDLLTLRLADCLEQAPRLGLPSAQAMAPGPRRFWSIVASRLGGPAAEEWWAYHGTARGWMLRRSGRPPGESQDESI